MLRALITRAPWRLVHPGFAPLETSLGPTTARRSMPTHPTEELRCVLVVMRHGDRAPKQKLKVIVRHPLYMHMFETHGAGIVTRKELKLKTSVEMKSLLRVIDHLHTCCWPCLCHTMSPQLSTVLLPVGVPENSLHAEPVPSHVPHASICF